MLTVLTLNRRQVRELDRRAIEELGIAGVVLMENAGRGVVERLVQHGVNGPVAICCGKGNNGGDGFVIARHLSGRGYDVRVLLFADQKSLVGDAAVNFRILQNCPVPITSFTDDVSPAQVQATLLGAGCIVDALLGTGSRGEPRGGTRTAIEAINAAQQASPPKPGQATPDSPIHVVAIDLPSGLDCDTGAAAGATVRATQTLTFVAYKPGFLLPASAAFTGRIEVIDLGVPRHLVEEVSGWN